MKIKHHLQSHRTVSIILVATFAVAVYQFVHYLPPIDGINFRVSKVVYERQALELGFKIGVLILLYRLRNHQSKDDMPK